MPRGGVELRVPGAGSHVEVVLAATALPRLVVRVPVAAPCRWLEEDLGGDRDECALHTPGCTLPQSACDLSGISYSSGPWFTQSTLEERESTGPCPAGYRRVMETEWYVHCPISGIVAARAGAKVAPLKYAKARNAGRGTSVWYCQSYRMPHWPGLKTPHALTVSVGPVRKSLSLDAIATLTARLPLLQRVSRAGPSSSSWADSVPAPQKDAVRSSRASR